MSPSPTPPGRCPACGAALVPLSSIGPAQWICPEPSCPVFLLEDKKHPSVSTGAIDTAIAAVRAKP